MTRNNIGEIALAFGGKPAEHITQLLGMPTSDPTLLRRIRRAPCAPAGAAVDHQKNLPEFLPDREAGTVEKWMGEHPEIDVATRDRSEAYKAGINGEAPQAVQVADRFHLLNAREALQRVVEQQRSALLQAALTVVTPKHAPYQVTVDPGPVTSAAGVAGSAAERAAAGITQYHPMSPTSTLGTVFLIASNLLIAFNRLLKIVKL